MFTKKMFAPPPSKDSSTSETKPQRELSPGEIIDKAIARLHLTMIEIQDTPSILHLMKSQLFYDTYDSMIYLCLSSLLAYGWSLAYSCYSPQSSSTSSYCWIVIIILVLMLYSVQILLQIMYMTGFTAKETRLALAMGAAAGALSVALFVMHASYVSDSTAEATAIHLNALVMQLNGSVVLLSTGQLKPIIYIALSALLSLLSMGLVIPAVRFASTFNKIISGSGTTPHLTFYRKAMMFSDIVLPFLVAILYSSVPDLLFGIHGGSNTGHTCSSSNSSSSSYVGSIDAVMSCSSSSDDATCDAGMGVGVAGYNKYPSDHHLYESGLLVAQLVVVLLMVFTRWSNLQAHLQTHLDSLVHLVAAQIIAPNGVSEESIATLQLKVKVCLSSSNPNPNPFIIYNSSLSTPSSYSTHQLCTGYLMAATSQYVAVPLFAAGCALLLHLSSPTGTGTCYGLYSLAGTEAGGREREGERKTASVVVSGLVSLHVLNEVYYVLPSHPLVVMAAIPPSTTPTYSIFSSPTHLTIRLSPLSSSLLYPTLSVPLRIGPIITDCFHRLHGT